MAYPDALNVALLKSSPVSSENWNDWTLFMHYSPLPAPITCSILTQEMSISLANSLTASFGSSYVKGSMYIFIPGDTSTERRHNTSYCIYKSFITLKSGSTSFCMFSPLWWIFVEYKSNGNFCYCMLTQFTSAEGLNNTFKYTRSKNEHVGRKTLEIYTYWSRHEMSVLTSHTKRWKVEEVKRVFLLNLRRGEFHVHSASFLGFKIERGSLKSDPAEIQAGAEWSVPTTWKQHRRSL